MTRSFVAPLFLLVAVIFADCTVPINWATQPEASHTPRPTANMTAQQRAAAETLLNDALLDAADIDATVVQRYRVVHDDLPGFIPAGGWLAAETMWDDTSDIQVLNDWRYMFADDASATAYQAATHDTPNATFAPGVADGWQTSVSAVYRNSSGEDARSLTADLVNGRVLASVYITFGAAADWQPLAKRILDTAKTRLDEALATTTVP
jgi:hypothetical protein